MVELLQRLVCVVQVALAEDFEGKKMLKHSEGENCFLYSTRMLQKVENFPQVSWMFMLKNQP